MPAGEETRVVPVPGRVNLIGEHIDYHGLPVLPVAIERSVRVAYRARTDRRIRVSSTAPYGLREFELTPHLEPVAPGDWENYLRAAALIAQGSWDISVGIDAELTSDLPAAAGLSSSTALIVGITMALLRANRQSPTFEALMAVLPEGEHFVGTRGGGMDHAAVLASRPGCASLIEFDPLTVRAIPIPADWAFLAAHCLETAEKSGGAREAYNARRRAGDTALHTFGIESYRAALAGPAPEELADRLTIPEERDSFLHVVTEAQRVYAAVDAMRHDDPTAFGRLLLDSHTSLRDRLRVSIPALDCLVELAMASGAMGARLTGAGFGGFAVIFCRKSDRPAIRAKLIDRYYSARPDFDEHRHLIDVEPGPGVLYEERHAPPNH